MRTQFVDKNVYDIDLKNINRRLDGTVYITTYILGAETVEVKTDSHTITAADFGKTIIINSASDKIFTMPSVGAGEVGNKIILGKWGTGKVTIQGVDADIFRSPDQSSSAPGTLYNAIDRYSIVKLKLITATEWVLEYWTGTAWVMT